MSERMPRVTARSGRIARACALGVLLWAAPAAAQNGGQAGEGESSRLPGWSFTPSIAFGAIYDSNVALSSPRADLRRNTGGHALRHRARRATRVQRPALGVGGRTTAVSSAVTAKSRASTASISAPR